MKHYDTHEIRVQIAKSVIVPRTYEYEGLEEKNKGAKIFRRILVAALSAGVIIAASFSSGLVYKTILSGIYSPVKIEINMPVSLSGNMDLPIKAFFFENDGNEIPELKGTDREFKVKGSRLLEKLMFVPETEIGRAGGNSTIYNIKPVYLRNGDYRVKVVVGPYVQWKSFTVKNENILLDFDYLQNMHRQMKVHCVAFDNETGEEISDRTNFEVLLNKGWTNIQNLADGNLSSGTVWKFVAKSEGYKDEQFSLLIDWYQDELFLSANLEKK